MNYKAACIQYDSRILDKEHNLRRLEEMIKDASRAGGKLIVLPEMCTTGYYFDSCDEIRTLAEPIPGGDTVNRFIELARQLDCYIVAGIGELDEGRLYNSCFLAGPEGYWGKHRKLHPFTPDTLWAKNGDQPIRIFDTPIGRIAMEICMDISFPETPRVAKLLGAEILCVPMNWCEPVIPSPIWITRALENQVYVLASNRQGNEKGHVFTGGSSIIGKNGEILDCIIRGDGWAMAEITPEDRPEMPEIIERRPQLYQELQLQRYHWPQNQYYRQFAVPPIPDGSAFQVAVAQMCLEKGDIHHNALQLIAVMEEAAYQNISLIVFPELALTGKPEGHEEAGAWALTEDCRTIEELARQTARLHLVSCFGFILRENGCLYNAAYCALPDGSRYIYRKSHLLAEEKSWASAGCEAGLCLDLPTARIGILIGDEIMVTELTRLLANRGCDMLLIPSMMEKPAFSCPKYSEERYLWHIGRVRGNENNTFILFANAGEYSGIFGPDVFKPVREESLPETGESLAKLTVSTKHMIYSQDSCEWQINPVREKMMLVTRQPVWYDRLLW